MTALHPKAPYWIRQGIFDDLRSFDVFEKRVNQIPEEKDRGDAFEIFIEGYLATQTITQCVKTLGCWRHPAVIARAIQVAARSHWHRWDL